MPRNGNGTPFRKGQAKYAIEGLVRWLAPAMMSPVALREAVEELAFDTQLWDELELAHAAGEPTVAVGKQTL